MGRVKLKFDSAPIALFWVGTCLNFLLASQSAHADLKIRGFADLVGSVTGSNYTLDWLQNQGTYLNIEGRSRLGLNLAANISDRWNLAGQIVGRGAPTLDGQTSYILSADWLFLTYRPTSGLSFKAGRQIYPIFLFSESTDVGFNYLWTSLPSSVYQVIPVKSLNGLSATYKYSMAGDLQASATAFAGAMISKVLSSGIGGTTVKDLDVWGGNLSLSSDSFKVQASYKSSHPLVDLYSPTPEGTQYQVSADLGVNQNLAFGGTFDLMNFTLIAEGSRSISTGGVYNVSGAYGTIAYHLWEGKLTPHITLGHFWSDAAGWFHPDPNVFQSQGTDALQTNWAQIIVGMNFSMSDTLTLKLEYQRDDMSYRNTSLNFGANTYAISLDTVF